MCSKSLAVRGSHSGTGPRVRHGGGEPNHFFGLDAAAMRPGAQVAAALAVIVMVALSGLFFAYIGVWWVVTTYGWVAFPAFGLLVRGVAGLSEARPQRATPEAKERELLGALRTGGAATAAGVAAETSLSVAEADRMLRDLASAGHLQVVVSGGGLAYDLWNPEPREAVEPLPEIEGAR